MIDAALARIAALPARAGRRLVALAGPPASGKTTLVHALAARVPCAAVVSMDGFHLDDTVLRDRGLLARKGAPQTFDVDGLHHALIRLAAGGEVLLPTFDRAREIAIAGSLVVGPEIRTVLVEGNWLLHRADGWDAVERLWHLRLWLDVPPDVLRARLLARWAHLPLDVARARVDGNDLPNAALAAAQRGAADLVLGEGPTLP